MKRFTLINLLMLVSVFFLMISVFAQADSSHWAFISELTAGPGTPGVYGFTVPLEVMDKSRDDLADLRIYDNQNKEIPSALRILQDVSETRPVSGSTFNNATAVANATEVSVDLGQSPGEHNQIEIETAGANFRRRVVVEGSDTVNDWKTLASNETIYSFSSDNRTAQSNRVNYPTSRYRYLRLRVFADELVDKTPPAIVNVNVMMAVRAKGERFFWNVNVPSYELRRNQGEPASSWTIDLGGRAPCDRLELDIDEASFSRPFQLEDVDDPENTKLLASGDLSRRVGEERTPRVITFEHEEHLRKLRLVVTDYSNQTLTINAIKASAPARELVFQLKDATPQPLRLLFGNPKATEPHYDFEKELPASLTTAPTRAVAGPVSQNPEYRPEPLPLTERVPWLIYLVLAASSVALAIILVGLARATLRSDAKPPGVDSQAGTA